EHEVAPNAKVLVVGSAAIEHEVRLVGLIPVRTAEPDVRAVVQGLNKDTSWRDLAEACVAINAGALWVACNVDPTLPTERGLKVATGHEPVIAGKPATPLMDEATRSAGATDALAIGDRLDTDIAGAIAAGLDSLLVLSGVSTAKDLLDGDIRPTYLAADVSAVTDDPDRLKIGDKPGWA
ncbi:MAG: HAD hydrolase-like protein, partial [Actinophytocola sp.]|nr:HAD hydrolase-like protein [Actinophytocola sp.]